MAHLNPKQEAFFQQPIGKATFNPASPVWYTAGPIGKNVLAVLMKNIAKDAGAVGVYTNHCIRGTSATALFREGLNLQEVANVTGHTNLESLKCYLERPSKEDKVVASDALFRYAHNLKVETKQEVEPEESHKETHDVEVPNDAHPDIIYSRDYSARVVQSTVGPVVIPQRRNVGASRK